MGPNEVSEALRNNADRIVELHFGDGEIQTAKIILVDDEGVVYDLIASTRRDAPPHDGQPALWTTFAEIEDVVSR